MTFTFHKLAIPEVLLIEPPAVKDPRGMFVEVYRRSAFVAAGITESFVQENQSTSSRGVLRGLHFQTPPHAQSKIVRVLSGEIFDVAVDLRAGSPTAGRWAAAILSSANRHMTYIPGFCAHGFYVLSETAEVAYLASHEYAPTHEDGVMWNDPALKIDWPVADPVLSARDTHWPPFSPRTYL